MRFAKGHGTGNDFLILPDPDGALALSPELAARLCDRRTGLGADGVLRAVRTAGGRVPSGGEQVPATGTAAAKWFMDYRNADGSIAEMCGNGARVFARYLLTHGLADGPTFAVATRAGTRQVWAEASGEITVDMGAPVVLGRGGAVVGGTECEGLAVSLGNPHLACVVDVPVAEFDLSAPPLVDHGQFPEGVNVEVVQVIGDRHLEMRVYERGSGATQSCGTGAVAAAVAAASVSIAPAGAGSVSTASAGSASPSAGAAGNGQAGLVGTWTVQVPGGRLVVALSEATSLLTGPAVIVAEGELSEAWLSGPAVGSLSGTA